MLNFIRLMCCATSTCVSSNLSILSYTVVLGMSRWMSLGISVVKLDNLLFAIVVSISRTVLYDTPWPSLFIIFFNSAFPVRGLMVNGRRTCLVLKRRPLLTVYNMSWPTEFTWISFLEFLSWKSLHKNHLRSIGITVWSSSRFWLFGGQFNVDLYDFISFGIVSAAMSRDFSVAEFCWYKFNIFCTPSSHDKSFSRNINLPSFFASKDAEMQNKTFWTFLQ